MVEKIIYVALDGTRFDIKNKCLEYENIINDISKIVSNLRDNDEVNSNTAVQQDIEIVKKSWKQFLSVCANAIPEWKDWFYQCAEGVRHESHIGRLLDDYSSEFPILYGTYFRFQCIDTSGVEYEQPYFSLHPNEFNGKII